MRELTLDDLKLAGVVLKRSVPDLTEVTTGIITLGRLRDLHQSNPISEEDRVKVRQSLDAVMAL